MQRSARLDVNTARLFAVWLSTTPAIAGPGNSGGTVADFEVVVGGGGRRGRVLIARQFRRHHSDDPDPLLRHTAGRPSYHTDHPASRDFPIRSRREYSSRHGNPY